MKKQIKGVMTALVLVCMPYSYAADTIRVSPGIDGGSKISTPWGDYLSIQIGDTLWVGTEQEWNDVKAAGVMNKEGAKRFRIEGEQKNQRTYVDRDAKTVSVANTRLGSVTTSILFGVKPSKKDKRPPKPSDSEYVQFVWIQSNNSKIGSVLSVNNSVIRPTDCDVNHGFYYCEFIVGRSLLKNPAKVIFYSEQKSPGIMEVDSLAKQHYLDVVLKYKRMKDISISKDDLDDLKQLHAIDEDIPEGI